jgi:hypothetical protein
LTIVAHEKAVIRPRPNFDQSFKARDSHMKKAADKESGSQGIGLATEHRLPKAFKAKTDDDAGTVEITKENARPLNIAINSFGAVSNLLAIFAPDGKTSLEPGHTIKIVDEFNNRSATITANAFVDVAAALNTFVVARGKYLPAAPDSEPALKKAAVRAAKAKTEAAPAAEAPKEEAPKEEATSKPGVKKPTAAKKGKAAGKAAPAAPETAVSAEAVGVEPAAAKAAAKGKEKAKTAAKSEATAAPAEWPKGLPTEHVDADGGFRLDARTLALPKERAKTTSGVSDGLAEHEAFGYEVSEGTKPGGKHLGYVIVEDPKSWIVTGFGDIPPTKHANLNAASIRIRVTNLRHLREA